MEIIDLIKQSARLRDDIINTLKINESLSIIDINKIINIGISNYTNLSYTYLNFYDSRIKDLLNTIISNKVSLENQRALTTTINSIRFLRYKDNISDELKQLFYKYDCYYQDIPVEGINKFDNTDQFLN